MPTTVSMTTYAAKLKQWYVDKKNLHRMDDFTTPLLAALPKDPTLSGLQWNQPIDYANPVSPGADYATQWNNMSAGGETKFYGDTKDCFASLPIGDKVMRASRDARGGYGPALGDKIEALRKQFLKKTNFDAYRDENGAIARMGTIASTATGTLSDNTLQAAQNITAGMFLSFGPNKDGTSMRTGGVKVQGVNPQTGKFFTTSPVAIDTQVTTLTAGDYVFIAGTSGSSFQAIAGLESWIPPDDSTRQQTFKNCDRSVNATYLGGIMIDASTKSVEDALIDGVTAASTYDADVKFLFTNPKRFGQLVKDLGSKANYQRVPGQSFDAKGKRASFSIGGIAIETGNGSVLVASDWACQAAYSWLVDPAVWKLYSMGTWPFVRDEDGHDIIRMLDGTSPPRYVTELFAYGELVCAAPGKNVLIKHATAA